MYDIILLTNNKFWESVIKVDNITKLHRIDSAVWMYEYFARKISS